MPRPKLCIELASQNERFGDFEEDDHARRAARAIMVDVSDRRGFSMDGVEEATQLEMVETWTELIRRVFGGEC